MKNSTSDNIREVFLIGGVRGDEKIGVKLFNNNLVIFI